MDRRRSSTPRPAGERRRGERRRRVASVLQYRRETDVRLDAGQFSALVQRWAVAARTLAPVRGLPPGELATAPGWPAGAAATRPGWADASPSPAPAAAAGAAAATAGPRSSAPAAAPAAVAAVLEAELEPEDGVPCPECGCVLDRLWLVRHLASVHPAWRG